jgi:MoaA/NifB/PqqE/SkfB family radical SAM enzyme
VADDGKAAQAPARLVVVWRVTTRCQLSCGFCAYDRALPFLRRDVDEESAHRLGRSLLQARAEPGQTVHVSFLGGEPLSWRPLPSVARELSKQGLSLGVTTNGALLGARWVRELLLDCFDEVTVSIDALGDVHDRLRGWPGGFERLTSGLQQLVEGKTKAGRGPLLRVNTVLMRDNLEQFPQLCRVLASWGVEQLTFNRLGGRDRPEFFAEHRASPQELERFCTELPALRRELAPRGLELLGAPAYLDRLLSLERGQALSVRDCQAGQRFLFVDEHGTVAPCSFSLDEYGEPWPTAPLGPEGPSGLSRRFLARQVSRRAAACDDCMSTQNVGKFAGSNGA